MKSEVITITNTLVTKEQAAVIDSFCEQYINDFNVTPDALQDDVACQSFMWHLESHLGSKDAHHTLNNAENELFLALLKYNDKQGNYDTTLTNTFKIHLSK